VAEDLRFGICIPPVLPVPQMIDQCRFVESLGYDSVWMADQFYNPLRPGDPMWEAWTLLAAVAAHTSRIRLGTLVTNFIYRNPALVASQALTVDHLSSGRLELGLGAGFSTMDQTMTGGHAWEPRERVGRFREAVQIVDLMLRNEVTNFCGEYYRVKDAVLSPRPIQKPRPPLTLGVTGPVAMKFAAAFADTWNTPDISPMEYGSGERISSHVALEACRRRQDAFDEYCVTSGRNPRDIRRSLLVGYANDVPNESLDAIHEYVGHRVQIGISEFIFFWIPDEYRDVLANRLSGFDRNMLERVAADGLPAWRK
jgi:alkanesulfonate monooxygenase SsuD/methylene tetrahydromethanopterin reductase-like flavin-dependent oxidoreductase (luciferase family)